MVPRYSTCFPRAQSQARVTPNHTSPLSTNFTLTKQPLNFTSNSKGEKGVTKPGMKEVYSLP